MKKFIYILFFLIPVVSFAQQPWYKYSPTDYTWKNVGNAGFSAGGDDYTSLAFSPSGQPYVAFEDVANSYKATVMKFDGTNWVNVGNAGFSAGGAGYTSLAFSPSNGQPYVAFIDWRASVMTFNGTNWVYVGSEGFSDDEIESTSLAFGTSGQPYVAYGGSDNSEEAASVMKFDGTNWVYVGTAGFSGGAAGYISLAFSPVDSMPYVAFSDEGSWFFGPATVMKYDSVYFGINELQESRLSLYPNPATDKITVELSGMTQGGNLTIVNIEGQQVMTRQITQPKTQIDISTLPSGVYFARLTEEKTVSIVKFVKQ